MLHVPTLYISIIILDIYNQRFERLHVHLKHNFSNFHFMVFTSCAYPHHLLGPVCLPSSTFGYLIYTYVLEVALIIVSFITGMHVRAWTVYHSCVCMCYNLIRVSYLFTSPFVPFQSSIMNRFLRVRPSQKLVYENLPVQTKIINGRSRMKLYLKYHWDGGKASVGFDQDLIRTLVSMATVSSHRVTVGKTASSNSRMFLIGTFLILAGNDDMHESMDEFEIWPDSTMDYGVSCPSA